MTSALKENRITKYLKEVRAETRKVTWPSRQEVLRLSTIVVIVLIVMSAFMAIVDFGFSRLMQAIISLGSGV
jgi:preprotein translocase subunit SecE